jgi:hypothetical protein
MPYEMHLIQLQPAGDQEDGLPAWTLNCPHLRGTHDLKDQIKGQSQWLTPIFPATWEAEIGRIAV